MAKFMVRRRVDAYVDYVAEVEAENVHQAAEFARKDEGALRWQLEGSCEFDARQFIALDSEGVEIDGTQVGDA